MYNYTLTTGTVISSVCFIASVAQIISQILWRSLFPSESQPDSYAVQWWVRGLQGHDSQQQQFTGQKQHSAMQMCPTTSQCSLCQMFYMLTNKLSICENTLVNDIDSEENVFCVLKCWITGCLLMFQTSLCHSF